MVKLSVIVPAYNAEKTIEKCLYSIINQSFREMEIIIINDGSQDSTSDIVNRIIGDNPQRIIRMITKCNQGLPQARKTGVEYSSGEYIGFVDADDWIEPNMYSRMIKSAELQRLDIVCCNFFKDYSDSVENFKQKEVNKIYCGHDALVLLNSRRTYYQYCWNKIYKKELFEGIAFPSINVIGEDYTIVLQLMIKAKRVVAIDYDGYHYVQFKGSMSRKPYSKIQKDSFMNYYNILINVYKTNNPQIIKSVDNYIANELIWIIISMRNGKYDYKVIDWIVKYLRRRAIFIVLNNQNSLLYKCSTIAVCVNFKLVCKAFEIYANHSHTEIE